MSNPYERVNPGRLTFKDGTLASRSKSIDKKKKKKNKKQQLNNPSHNPEQETVITASIDPEDENAIEAAAEAAGAEAQGGEGGEEESAPYSIDAAKRMNYDELFPVEAKKFGYDPKLIKQKTTVEAALDDRVKKKADRYCK